MSKYLFYGLALSLGACASRSDGTKRVSAEPSRPAIFRKVSIAPFGSIELGAAFAQRSTPNAVAIGPAIFALVGEGGHFADADSILVRVDAENRVSELRFVHQATKSYDAAMGDYEQLLGKPLERADVDSVAVARSRSVWQDAYTRFELWRVGSASASRVSSVLRDRASAPP